MTMGEWVVVACFTFLLGGHGVEREKELCWLEFDLGLVVENCVRGGEREDTRIKLIEKCTF